MLSGQEFIGIEITESTLLMAFNDVSKKLSTLKEEGYRFIWMISEQGIPL